MAAQVEALTEKLEAVGDSRQPVLESSNAEPAQGDPSLWTAEYARARSASAPIAGSRTNASISTGKYPGGGIMLWGCAQPHGVVHLLRLYCPRDVA